MEQNNLIINKAFFGGKPGARNVLSVTLNKNKECYFNFGKEKPEGGYSWTHCKMNDSELGEIINVIADRQPSTAFYHKFKEKDGETARQIWVSKSEDRKTLFIKVKELAKPLSLGEQKILELLLEQIIIRMSLE